MVLETYVKGLGMYCSKCGQYNMDGDMYCWSCGNPIAYSAAAYDDYAPVGEGVPTADGGYVQVPVPGSVYEPVPRSAEPLPMPAPKKRPRRGWVTLLLAGALSLGIILWQVVGLIVSSLTGLDMDLCITLAGAIGAVVGVIILGGKELLRPDWQAFALAWKKGWWVVAVSVLLMLLEVSETVVTGDPLAKDGWPLRCIAILLLCVGVGFYEEGLFRGLVLGGLLDPFGGKKAGVVASIVLSSIVFGAMHIVGSDLDSAEPLSFMQAFLKTLQTGTYGFFLAALVTKTGDLYGAIVLHALGDFFLMVPSSVLYDQAVETEYVTSGSDALPTIILYVIIIIAYLPIVWQGVRLLGEVRAPHHGAMHKE